MRTGEIIPRGSNRILPVTPIGEIQYKRRDNPHYQIPIKYDPKGDNKLVYVKTGRVMTERGPATRTTMPSGDVVEISDLAINLENWRKNE